MTARNMVGSYALQMSSRDTTEAEEHNIPLTSWKERKTSQIPLRQSLIGVANSWSRSTTDDIFVNAIAQLGEDRRRASIAIRRQSVLLSQQDAPSEYPLQPPRSHRESIRAYRPSAGGGRQSVSEWRQEEFSEQGGSNERKQSIVGERRASTTARRTSVADRRRSSVAPVRTHRRSSVLDVVTASTAQAVRRASLAM